MITLDEQDLNILEILQDEASKPTAEVAEIVGLSLSPCWRRIRRMRDAGVIRKDVALLDRKAIGLEIEEKYCEIAARRMEQEASATVSKIGLTIAQRSSSASPYPAIRIIY